MEVQPRRRIQFENIQYIASPRPTARAQRSDSVLLQDQGGKQPARRQEEPCEASPERQTTEPAWTSKQGATGHGKGGMPEDRPGPKEQA